MVVKETLKIFVHYMIRLIPKIHFVHIYRIKVFRWYCLFSNQSISIFTNIGCTNKLSFAPQKLNNKKSAIYEVLLVCLQHFLLLNDIHILVVCATTSICRNFKIPNNYMILYLQQFWSVGREREIFLFIDNYDHKWEKALPSFLNCLNKKLSIHPNRIDSFSLDSL